MKNKSTKEQVLLCNSNIKTIIANSIERIYYSNIEYPGLDDFDSAIENAKVTKESNFTISLEPILPAPGKYYFSIHYCDITKNLILDNRLRDVISICFQLISDDSRLFFLKEEILCPDPLETRGRYFELFGQLLTLYGMEDSVQAKDLIDHDGYATLAYVLSKDKNQLYPILTNIQ
jgi:hypothetical protein